MTPENKIKRAILLRAMETPDVNDTWIPEDVKTLDTNEGVESIYTEFCEQDLQWDAESEFREGEVETDIEAPFNRNYESKSVAANVDGEWIGWTYWYGGGKHGNPEEIPWMKYAYELNCTEEEKLVVIRKFSKK